MAIRSKHQLLPVGRKHRKAIKGVVVSYALHAGAVRLNHVEIEVAALRIGDVRRENYPLAVGKEIGREAGFVQMRDLSLVRAIGIHHPNLQHGWTN